MKLTDFVVPGAVIPSLQVSNKEAAIRGMSIAWFRPGTLSRVMQTVSSLPF